MRRGEVPSHYLHQYWLIVDWTSRNQIQWHFNEITNIFCQENAFEHIVSKIAAIWVRLPCVTFLVLKLEHSGRSWSIPWLLMPWLLALPGHQQPWYWLNKINKSSTATRKDFYSLCHLNFARWKKKYPYFLCFLKTNSAWQGSSPFCIFFPWVPASALPTSWEVTACHSHPAQYAEKLSPKFYDVLWDLQLFYGFLNFSKVHGNPQG